MGFSLYSVWEDPQIDTTGALGDLYANITIKITIDITDKLMKQNNIDEHVDKLQKNL
jgi:hypothetical protein